MRSLQKFIEGLFLENFNFPLLVSCIALLAGIQDDFGLIVGAATLFEEQLRSCQPCACL